MHSGKTTLTNILVNDYGFKRLAFADPVKMVATEMLRSFRAAMNDVVWAETNEPVPYYTLDDINAMKGHPAIRGLLQLIGTELGRNWYGPEDVWIKAFQRVLEYTEEQDETTRIVCDDCRFINEAEALKNMGFTVIRIMRDGPERLDSIRLAIRREHPLMTDTELEAALIKMQEHPSEVEQDNIESHFAVYNDSIPDLHSAARWISEAEDSDGR